MLKSIGIDVVDRVIDHIAVAVEALRITGIRNRRIWGDPSRQLWVIVSAAVVEKAGLRVLDLAVEAPERFSCALLSGDFSPRIILNDQ